ncbi:MAG: divalent-cation tolerance protein CutA [Pirellulales bacterium]
MPDFLEVITTASSEEEARAIAEALVSTRLAGCVQIDGPLTSVYRWEGEVEVAQEWRCTVKTRAELFGLVEQTIREAHSYSVPQIIALPIMAGSVPYLEWLANETAYRPGGT